MQKLCNLKLTTGVWQDRDESGNPSQKHDVELVKDEKRCVTVSLHMHSEDWEGRLQSLDWTSGLDWWTDTKNHFYTFYQDLLACRVMWKPCSLLSAHTVTE